MSRATRRAARTRAEKVLAKAPKPPSRAAKEHEFDPAYWVGPLTVQMAYAAKAKIVAERDRPPARGQQRRFLGWLFREGRSV